MTKSILIVDDDPVLQKMVTPFLVSNGYNVINVADGQSALEAITMNKPDVILLDIQMPRMNGYTFIFEIRNIPEARHIPIIVITAKEGMEDIFKVEGVKDYLTKPVDHQQLLKSIQLALK